MSRPRSKHPVYGTMTHIKPRAELEEGTGPFDRFRKTMKTIVSVPKDSITKDCPRPRSKDKKDGSP